MHDDRCVLFTCIRSDPYCSPGAGALCPSPFAFREGVAPFAKGPSTSKLQNHGFTAPPIE
eukprot:4756459-Prymnesium_polylepis.1